MKKQNLNEEIARIKSMMGKLISEDYSLDMDEMDYESFHNADHLSELRDAIDNNKMVSVAFVKKDGEVRHMLIRRHLKSYIGSDREKSDAQLNVESNNDVKTVFDMSLYKKLIRELTLENPGMSRDEITQIAAKKCVRRFLLKNVLGFMAGGKFIDVRDENDIMNRFGEEVYNKLTKSMIRSIEQQEGEENLNESEGDDDELYSLSSGEINGLVSTAHEEMYNELEIEHGRGGNFEGLSRVDLGQYIVIFNIKYTVDEDIDGKYSDLSLRISIQSKMDGELNDVEDIISPKLYDEIYDNLDEILGDD